MLQVFLYNYILYKSDILHVCMAHSIDFIILFWLAHDWMVNDFKTLLLVTLCCSDSRQ